MFRYVPLIRSIEVNTRTLNKMCEFYFFMLIFILLRDNSFSIFLYAISLFCTLHISRNASIYCFNIFVFNSTKPSSLNFLTNILFSIFLNVSSVETTSPLLVSFPSSVMLSLKNWLYVISTRYVFFVSFTLKDIIFK